MQLSGRKKEWGLIFTFLLPVFCFCVFFLNRKLLYYRVMYALLGLKIAIWNLAEIEARSLLDKSILLLQFKMKFRDRDHTTWLCTGLLCAEMLNNPKMQCFHRRSFFCIHGLGSLKFQRHYMSSFNELVSGFPAADVTSSFISCFPSIAVFQLFCVFLLLREKQWRAWFLQ